MTLALRAQLLRQRDSICSKASLLHVDGRLWTIDLDSLCLGFYTFKVGTVIKLIYGVVVRSEYSIKITHLHHPYCA